VASVALCRCDVLVTEPLPDLSLVEAWSDAFELPELP
jgi:hypothetical protein